MSKVLPITFTVKELRTLQTVLSAEVVRESSSDRLVRLTGALAKVESTLEEFFREGGDND